MIPFPNPDARSFAYLSHCSAMPAAFMGATATGFGRSKRSMTGTMSSVSRSPLRQRRVTASTVVGQGKLTTWHLTVDGLAHQGPVVEFPSSTHHHVSPGLGRRMTSYAGYLISEYGVPHEPVSKRTSKPGKSLGHGQLN